MGHQQTYFKHKNSDTILIKLVNHPRRPRVVIRTVRTGKTHFLRTGCFVTDHRKVNCQNHSISCCFQSLKIKSYSVDWTVDVHYYDGKKIIIVRVDYWQFANCKKKKTVTKYGVIRWSSDLKALEPPSSIKQEFNGFTLMGSIFLKS